MRRIKRWVAILLCCVFATFTPVRETKAGATVVVVLVVGVIAGGFIIWIYCYGPVSDHRPVVTVVLQGSADNLTWFPLATNQVMVNTGPTPAFQGIMDDHPSWYFRGVWDHGTNIYNFVFADVTPTFVTTNRQVWAIPTDCWSASARSNYALVHQTLVEDFPVRGSGER